MDAATFQDLRRPGATLGAGVSGGFIAGVVIGGLGGRLAMLALRVTSDPTLRGVSTDDGFTIGRVSSQTLFLLGVTAGLGMAGGLFYLAIRRWIPGPWRIAAMTLFFALAGGAGLIGPSEVDFKLLSPLSLAVTLFIVIPAIYGAAMPWLVERWLREDSFLRRGERTWIIGLVPLVFANVVGLLVLLVAFGLWSLGRRTPVLLVAWVSGLATWLGRAALVAMAAVSGMGLLRDGMDILG